MRVGGTKGAAAAVALAGVLLACGSSGSQVAAANPGDHVDPGGGTSGSGVPCGGFVTLRLLGVNGGTAVSSFAVEHGSLEVTSGGPLAISGAVAGPLDLAQGAAYRLGIVAPPAGAKVVQVSFSITAAHVAGTGVTGDLDVCTAPIAFAFDTSLVDPGRCHVVVELDLTRSAQPAPVPGAAPLLLPQFRVVY